MSLTGWCIWRLGHSIYPAGVTSPRSERKPPQIQKGLTSRWHFPQGFSFRVASKRGSPCHKSCKRISTCGHFAPGFTITSAGKVYFISPVFPQVTNNDKVIREVFRLEAEGHFFHHVACVTGLGGKGVRNYYTLYTSHMHSQTTCTAGICAVVKS